MLIKLQGKKIKKQKQYESIFENWFGIFSSNGWEKEMKKSNSLIHLLRKTVLHYK